MCLRKTNNIWTINHVWFAFCEVNSSVSRAVCDAPLPPLVKIWHIVALVFLLLNNMESATGACFTNYLFLASTPLLGMINTCIFIFWMVLTEIWSKVFYAYVLVIFCQNLENLWKWYTYLEDSNIFRGGGKNISKIDKNINFSLLFLLILLSLIEIDLCLCILRIMTRVTRFH